MPEGVEVEILRRSIQPVVGATVASADLSAAGRTLRYHAPGAIFADVDPPDLLVGSQVAATSRRGKHLLISLSKLSQLDAPSPTLGIHLGMSGVLLLDTTPLEHRWTRLRLSFSDSPLHLSYVDPRGFGYVAVSPNRRVGPWTSTGPDALTSTSSALAASLYAHASRSVSKPLKALLLDQRVIAGVGNIYADEALFDSKVSPDAKASELSEADWVRLSESVKKVMELGLTAGGATLADGSWYRPDGSDGDGASFHRVYARAGLPCFDCATPISTVKLAGRTTHFCASCQLSR